MDATSTGRAIHSSTKCMFSTYCLASALYVGIARFGRWCDGSLDHTSRPLSSLRVINVGRQFSLISKILRRVNVQLNSLRVPIISSTNIVFPIPKFFLPLLFPNSLYDFQQIADEHLEQSWRQSTTLRDPLLNVEEVRQFSVQHYSAFRTVCHLLQHFTFSRLSQSQSWTVVSIAHFTILYRKPN